MKQFSFLQLVVLAALLVTVVSCSVPMGTTDDYYEEAPARRNVYYGDPYYGGVNTIIVERDPYTGRYYQVSPGYYGGGMYSTPVYPRGGRVYNRGGGRYYNNNNRNNTTSRNNNYYRTYPQVQQQQQQPRRQQAPAPSPQVQQERREAKDAILGKRRN